MAAVWGVAVSGVGDGKDSDPYSSLGMGKTKGKKKGQDAHLGDLLRRSQQKAKDFNLEKTAAFRVCALQTVIPQLWLFVLTGNYQNHVTEPEDRDGAYRTKMQSILETNDLDEFLTTAEMADRDFEADHSRVVVVGPSSSHATTKKSAEEVAASLNLLSIERRKQERERAQDLRIPRRPAWSRDMPVEELNSNEKLSFLEWRRSLADLEQQEGITLTPFEKNLEVWRQLWRVVERSHIVIQIVDARNPLLFFCSDLNKYVHEIGPEKHLLLLVNKADLLTEKQRYDCVTLVGREKKALDFVAMMIYVD